MGLLHTFAYYKHSQGLNRAPISFSTFVFSLSGCYPFSPYASLSYTQAIPYLLLERKKHHSNFSRLNSNRLQSPVSIHRGLAPELPQKPKSTHARVPYIKWLSTVSPTHIWMWKPRTPRSICICMDYHYTQNLEIPARRKNNKLENIIWGHSKVVRFFFFSLSDMGI